MRKPKLAIARSDVTVTDEDYSIALFKARYLDGHSPSKIYWTYKIYQETNLVYDPNLKNPTLTHGTMNAAIKWAQSWISQQENRPSNYVKPQVPAKVAKVVKSSILENEQLSQAIQKLTEELQDEFPLLKITEENAIRVLMLRGIKEK